MQKWIEEQLIRDDERRKTLRELQDIVKKAKEKKNKTQVACMQARATKYEIRYLRLC
jgi:hypothetical protein